ncbi:MAG: hypothetical protein NVSMB46_00010 [Candidatus Saccharimonadales bacterium]
MQPGETIKPNEKPTEVVLAEKDDLTSPQGFIDNSGQTVEKTTDQVRWTASEFIVHKKNKSWYSLLAIFIAAIAAIVYFVTRDITPAGLIIIMGVIFGFFAAQRPRVLQYTIDNEGITIGDRHFLYNDFKFYSITKLGAIQSIVLSPLKRFMPSINLYYEPKDEDNILSVIGEYLPYEEFKGDKVETLMHRLRF